MTRKWLFFLLVCIVFSVFLYGCAQTGEITKLRCAKCGAFFNSKEGAEEFERMRAEPYGISPSTN
jgi:hypothetical protein